jgi:predicted unusual protein kinase regulating ubiquinone biosynthesis (AarF/ABC1/UbiB family)
VSTGTNVLRRVDALIRVGLRLARSARTGQILLARIAEAIELEWIPRPWGDELVGELEEALAAAREPIPWQRVQRILRDAWDAPLTAELDDLDPEPVAVTPTAQVHRGVVDGAPVAVKIRRPGLAVSVRQDLVLLDALLAPLSSAFPALDAREVVGEFRERVLEELDLEHEAEVQRRFHRALRGHPFLSVPAPVTRLAHENVLVSEWVDARPVNEALDPDQAAGRLLVFVVGGIREGIIHADPVPDNVLVYADGRIALLDFGATRLIERERVEPSAAVAEAFCARDGAALGASLETLGLLPASLGDMTLELVLDALGEFADPDPVRLDSAAVIEIRDRLLARSEPLSELLTSGKLPPMDLWPARGVAEAFATIARLGATGRWRELVRAALRDGWQATA